VCAYFSFLFDSAVLCVLLENEQQFSSRFFNDFCFSACNLAQMVCGQVLSIILLLPFIGVGRKEKPRSSFCVPSFCAHHQTVGPIFPPRFFSFSLFFETIR
jgi:hypothetical protein